MAQPNPLPNPTPTRWQKIADWLKNNKLIVLLVAIIIAGAYYFYNDYRHDQAAILVPPQFVEAPKAEEKQPAAPAPAAPKAPAAPAPTAPAAPAPTAPPVQTADKATLDAVKALSDQIVEMNKGNFTFRWELIKVMEDKIAAIDQKNSVATQKAIDDLKAQVKELKDKTTVAQQPTTTAPATTPAATPAPAPAVAQGPATGMCGDPIVYEDTGNTGTIVRAITVASNERAIIGGYWVRIGDSLQGRDPGHYLVLGPGNYTVTLTNGFWLRTSAANAQCEHNKRIDQARANHWALSLQVTNFSTTGVVAR